MADKRITEVDFASSLSGDESFFINQGNTLKQISRSDIVFNIANGGTGATDGSTGLHNLLAGGAMILTSYQYGDVLPSDATEGRIFFKKVSS